MTLIKRGMNLIDDAQNMIGGALFLVGKFTMRPLNGKPLCDTVKKQGSHFVVFVQKARHYGR
jgi:hypothetical protein